MRKVKLYLPKATSTRHKMTRTKHKIDRLLTQRGTCINLDMLEGNMWCKGPLLFSPSITAAHGKMTHRGLMMRNVLGFDEY